MANQQQVLDKLDDLVETLRSRASVKNPNPTDSFDDLADKLAKLPDQIATKVADCISASREKSAGKADKSSMVRANNPTASVARRLDRLEDLRGQRDKVLDAVGDALDALDEGDTDNAEEILDEILEEYKVDEGDRNGGDEN